MEIDLSAFRRAEILLSSVSTLAALVYGWLLLKFRNEFAAASKVDALAARVDTLEQRIGTIEGAVNHLPTREDTHQLALSLADMRGDVRGVAARLEGMEKLIAATGRKVELIDEHLQGRQR